MFYVPENGRLETFVPENGHTVWGPVLGHFWRKLVFLTSEEPQELEISARANYIIQLFVVKLSTGQ